MAPAAIAAKTASSALNAKTTETIKQAGKQAVLQSGKKAIEEMKKAPEGLEAAKKMQADLMAKAKESGASSAGAQTVAAGIKR